MPRIMVTVCSECARELPLEGDGALSLALHQPGCTTLDDLTLIDEGWSFQGGDIRCPEHRVTEQIRRPGR